MVDHNSLDALYPVMEHFYTLQGEGRYAGHAAYFIRLGGCDVGCVWCDVKESWDADRHPKYTVATIVEWVKQSKAQIVVITGGEPAMHDLTDLTQALKSISVRIHIETSATSELRGYFDWVTFSPKKFKAPLPTEILKSNELKVIIYHKSDFEFAESFLSLVSKDCLLYLQVEWSKKDILTEPVIAYIKQHPQWQLSIQTHKYINIP